MKSMSGDHDSLTDKCICMHVVTLVNWSKLTLTLFCRGKDEVNF